MRLRAYANIRQAIPGPWAKIAACRDQPLSLFFDTGPGNGPTEALRICARCPVRIACDDFATETRQQFGIWGGLTEAARKRKLRIIRLRERAANA